MGLGPAVNSFVRNLLGEADEEQCVFEVTGGAPERPEVSKPIRRKSPPISKPTPPAAPPAAPSVAVPEAASAAAAPSPPPPPAAPEAAPESASPARKKKLKGAGNPKTKGVPGINPPPPEPDSSEEEDEEGELLE